MSFLPADFLIFEGLRPGVLRRQSSVVRLSASVVRRRFVRRLSVRPSSVVSPSVVRRPFVVRPPACRFSSVVRPSCPPVVRRRSVRNTFTRDRLAA